MLYQSVLFLAILSIVLSEDRTVHGGSGESPERHPANHRAKANPNGQNAGQQPNQNGYFKVVPGHYRVVDLPPPPSYMNYPMSMYQNPALPPPPPPPQYHIYPTFPKSNQNGNYPSNGQMLAGPGQMPNGGYNQYNGNYPLPIYPNPPLLPLPPPPPQYHIYPTFPNSNQNGNYPSYGQMPAGSGQAPRGGYNQNNGRHRHGSKHPHSQNRAAEEPQDMQNKDKENSYDYDIAGGENHGPDDSPGYAFEHSSGDGRVAEQNLAAQSPDSNQNTDETKRSKKRVMKKKSARTV